MEAADPISANYDGFTYPARSYDKSSGNGHKFPRLTTSATKHSTPTENSCVKSSPTSST